MSEESLEIQFYLLQKLAAEGIPSQLHFLKSSRDTQNLFLKACAGFIYVLYCFEHFCLWGLLMVNVLFFIKL